MSVAEAWTQIPSSLPTKPSPSKVVAPEAHGNTAEKAKPVVKEEAEKVEVVKPVEKKTETAKAPKAPKVEM